MTPEKRNDDVPQPISKEILDRMSLSPEDVEKAKYEKVATVLIRYGRSAYKRLQAGNGLGSIQMGSLVQYLPVTLHSPEELLPYLEVYIKDSGKTQEELGMDNEIGKLFYSMVAEPSHAMLRLYTMGFGLQALMEEDYYIAVDSLHIASPNGILNNDGIIEYLKRKSEGETDMRVLIAEQIQRVTTRESYKLPDVRATNFPK